MNFVDTSLVCLENVFGSGMSVRKNYTVYTVGYLYSTKNTLYISKFDRIGVRVRLFKPSASTLDCHISHQSLTDLSFSTGQQQGGVRTLGT